MTRFWYALTYLGFIIGEVLAGTLRVARAAFGPGVVSDPAIVQVPLRCRTDLEIVLLASCITITPGTLVVGTAPATEDAPPTLFVHSLFEADRQRVLAGLRDMESRLLRATRTGDR